MNSERHEELAALAALDLLTPAEQAEFAAALAARPELAALVASFRSTSAALAHTAPAAEPPAALKARILATVSAAPAAAQPAAAKVIAFPGWLTFASLAAAAGFAFAAAYFGQAYVAERGTASAFRDQQTLTDLALRGARNQLEAERLINRRELADAAAKSAEATARAADSARAVASLESRLDELNRNTSGSAGQLAAAREQLTALRRELATRDERVTALARELANQGNLADYKIATLASLLGNSPQALAVAVWNPVNQEGVLSVQKLPALAEDKDYQLWIIDPQYKIPVDGGVFRVDPATGEARVVFHPHQPVRTAAKFAVSLERKGGVPKAEGQMVLITPP